MATVQRAFLAKSLAYSWKMSLAGQVLWKRKVVVCAIATIGADMAAPATAAPFRRPRRRGVVRSVIVESPGVVGKSR